MPPNKSLEPTAPRSRVWRDLNPSEILAGQLLLFEAVNAEKLLYHSFSLDELRSLSEHTEFVEQSEKIETVDEFEKLCALGVALLKKKQISNVLVERRPPFVG